MLTRRGLREAKLCPPCLHLQKREERAYLLLDRVEPDEPIQLRLKLVEALPRLLSAQRLELISELLTNRLADLLPKGAQRVERVRRHASYVPSAASRKSKHRLGCAYHAAYACNEALIRFADRNE